MTSQRKHGTIWDMDTEREHVIKYPDSPLRRRKMSGDVQGRDGQGNNNYIKFYLGSQGLRLLLHFVDRI